MACVAAMIVYALTSAAPDYSAVRFLFLLLFAIPLMLGIAYLVRRFIEGLAD
jgi:flagellar biogenesis protein FliO